MGQDPPNPPPLLLRPNHGRVLDDLDPEQYVLDSVSDFFMLYTSKKNVDDSPLVGSIRHKVHINELSRGHAL